MNIQIQRCLPKVRQLENAFGGNWVHVPFKGHWYDTKSSNYVQRVCMCFYADGDDCSCGGRPHLYGKPSGWIVWGKTKANILGKTDRKGNEPTDI